RDFEIWKSGSRSFEKLAPATWATGGRIFRGAGPAQGVLAMPVRLDFFSLLGVPAELGRTFQPDDLNRGCTVVLSHRFWSQAFRGQKYVAGRHIALDEDACTIAGDMQPGFSISPYAAPMWILIRPDRTIELVPDEGDVTLLGG